MNLRINLRIVVGMCFILAPRIYANAAMTETNPAEVAAIITGENNLSLQLSRQIGNKTTTSLSVGTMTLVSNKMKKWERDYNSYLQSAGNFASAIIGSCNIFAEGVRTFLNLRDIETSARSNPQGPFASLSMTNLYVEVGMEFVDTYKLLQIAKQVATNNLASGADRTKMIWMVSDKMSILNLKLHKLALSIGMYTFEDVWNQAVAGMLEKSHGQIAREAQRRMQRAVGAATRLYLANN